MTDLYTPREGLSYGYACEEISAMYKRVQSDTDRKEGAQALADRIHQDTTARDYGELLSRQTHDLTREELLRRDFYQYGSTLKSADDVELAVDYMSRLDRGRNR